MRVKHAGESRERRAEDEGRQFRAHGRDSHAGGRRLVLTHREAGKSAPRPGEEPAGRHRDHKEGKAEREITRSLQRRAEEPGARDAADAERAAERGGVLKYRHHDKVYADRRDSEEVFFHAQAWQSAEQPDGRDNEHRDRQ